MGLDWNPGNRPKAGFEAEFERLFHALQGPATWWRKRKERRFFEISISAFETLAAPRVGKDEAATNWALERYREGPREVSEAEWLAKLDGFYVVDLLRPCDGIPRYSNGTPGGYVEPFSFRAQFLVDCEYILGGELLESCYLSKLPSEFRAHGEALESKFESFVSERGIDPESLESEDPESPLWHADVVRSAAKWCSFWANRGHVLDAYW